LLKEKGEQMATPEIRIQGDINLTDLIRQIAREENQSVVKRLERLEAFVFGDDGKLPPAEE
jgi:hypothetical protein